MRNGIIKGLEQEDSQILKSQQVKICLNERILMRYVVFGTFRFYINETKQNHFCAR